MARGATAKAELLEKLQEVFPDAFMQDAKVMRIPWIEDGQTVELKLSLTCAKDILGNGTTANKPTAAQPIKGGDFDWSGNTEVPQQRSPVIEPTEEEKANLETLLKALNL